jgi:hypothetical protein
MFRRLRLLVGRVSNLIRPSFRWPASHKSAVSLRFSLLSPFAKPLMSSIQSVHVHFPALLEQPPVDRVRKVSFIQLAQRYVTYTYLYKKLITASVGWSIPSWRNRKAVAIGCFRPTCSGVVDKCQLPPLSPSPKRWRQGARSKFLPRYCLPLHRLSPPITYSWGNFTPPVLRLHCRRPCSPLSLKQDFLRSLGLGNASIGSQEANRPRTTRLRRLNSWVSGSVHGTRDDARRR